MDDDLREMRTCEPSDLANDLLQARDGPGGCGRAVFLVGAGCSFSAGIPLATGVAQHAAIQLATVYLERPFATPDNDLSEEAVREPLAAVAIEALVAAGKLPHDLAYKGGDVAWGDLYKHFFNEHLKAPNGQRELISKVIELAGSRLNWTHACLGELVARRFVHTVLTTNFDQLVLKGIIRTGLVPVIADGVFAFNRILGRPLVPQVVHLHGSMHTYSLRNSNRSLNEAGEDKGTVSMMNSMLQQCDVLVVVGYAGGDSVMDMLLDATRRLEGLVVYWVVRNAARAWSGSAKLRELLRRENKFVIEGGNSDVFFANLMSELRLGQPEWMRDPSSGLREMVEQLVVPTEVEGVAPIFRAFEGRVEAAAACADAWRPPTEPVSADAKLDAAERRAKGDFAGARAALAGIDLGEDPKTARLHAVDALSLFQKDQTGQRAMLDAALAEFGALVERTAGRERATNLLHFAECLVNLSEAKGEDKHEAQRRIIAAVDKWLPSVEADADRRTLAEVRQARAVARHALADLAGADLDALGSAEVDYRAACELVEGSPDASGLVNEVREGLAGVLQSIGRLKRDKNKVQEAVELLRETVDFTARNSGSAQDGGLLFNLAGALADLVELAEPDERARLRSEAKHALVRSLDAFWRQGDQQRIEEVGAMATRLGIVLSARG